MKCQLSSSGYTGMSVIAFVLCCNQLQSGNPPGGYWLFDHKHLVDNRACKVCRAGVLVRAYLSAMAAGEEELAPLALAELEPPLQLDFYDEIGRVAGAGIIADGLREAYLYCRNIERRYAPKESKDGQR